MVELKRDLKADAIYIYLSSKPYAYGKDLDNERRIDYASDDTPLGIELLCVSKGVNVGGLPNADEIAELLHRKGIKVYAMEQRVETGQGYSSVLFSVKPTSLTATRDKGQARLHEEVTM